jgi:hypothetical protein
LALFAFACHPVGICFYSLSFVIPQGSALPGAAQRSRNAPACVQQRNSPRTSYTTKTGRTIPCPDIFNAMMLTISPIFCS